MPTMCEILILARSSELLSPTLTWSLGGVGQFVKLEVTLHGHVARKVTELHLNQFLGVDRAMPVPATQYQY